MAGNGEIFGWNSSPERADASSAAAEGSTKKEKDKKKGSGSPAIERQLPIDVREKFRHLIRPAVEPGIVLPWQQEANDKKESAIKPSESKQEPAVEKKDADNQTATPAGEAIEAHDENKAVEQDDETAQETATEQADTVTEQSGDDNTEHTDAGEAETGDGMIEVPLETGAASPEDQAVPDALTPLDLPLYQPDVHGPNPAELAGGLPQHPASMHEAVNTPAWVLPEYNPAQHDTSEDYEPLDNASPYTHAQQPQPMPGGNNAGRPPRASYAPGHNPNAMPNFNAPNVLLPLAAVPAAANMVGLRARAHEVTNAFWGGLVAGLLGGAFAGSVIGRRIERAKAERALAKQAHEHQVAAAGYQAQLAEARSQNQSLAARQEYARPIQVPAAEVAAPLAAAAVAHEMATAERSAPPVAETQPDVMKTEGPKRVELMTDPEVHEASRNVRIGDKTLHELRENGTVTASDERKLLQLAEQGGLEDAASRYRFDQEVQHVLMRHELDPMLAQQLLQHDMEAAAEQSQHHVDSQELAVQNVSAPPLQLPAAPANPQAQLPAAANRPPQVLVALNIIAACVLGTLLVVLAVVWFTR